MEYWDNAVVFYSSVVSVGLGEWREVSKVPYSETLAWESTLYDYQQVNKPDTPFGSWHCLSVKIKEIISRKYSSQVQHKFIRSSCVAKVTKIITGEGAKKTKEYKSYPSISVAKVSEIITCAKEQNYLFVFSRSFWRFAIYIFFSWRKLSLLVSSFNDCRIGRKIFNLYAS